MGKGYSFGLEFTRLTIPLKAKQKDLKNKAKEKKSRTQLLLTSVEEIDILFEKKVLGTRIFFFSTRGEFFYPLARRGYVIFSMSLTCKITDK